MNPLSKLSGIPKFAVVSALAVLLASFAATAMTTGTYLITGQQDFNYFGYNFIMFFVTYKIVMTVFNTTYPEGLFGSKKDDE